MLEYIVNDNHYGVELLEIDTDIVHDMTFGSPKVVLHVNRVYVTGVIWYRDEGIDFARGSRFHFTIENNVKNPLTMIEGKIFEEIEKIEKGEK